MPGVEIHDKHPRGFLAFDLKEILRCLGHDALDRAWRCVNLECTGEAMEELEALEQSGAAVSGERLLALAERTNQVIWGDFLGRRSGEAADTLRIHAIDGTVWEVFGDDDCLGKVRATFKDVRTASEEAG
jgi:hypothetical protein